MTHAMEHILKKLPNIYNEDIIDIPIDYLFEDKAYWGAHMHEIKGYEILMNLTNRQCGMILKEIQCPHCKKHGTILYPETIIGTNRKMWHRSCCKAFIYKYKA